MKSLRKAGAFHKGDERILGDGDFVEKVLSEAREAFERRYRLKAKGVDVEGIARKDAEIAGIAPGILCDWVTSELGISQAWPSKRLGLMQPAISLAAARERQRA